MISTPDYRRKHTQLCHVNLLKPYYSPSSVSSSAGEGKSVAVATPAEDLKPTLLADGIAGIKKM